MSQRSLLRNVLEYGVAIVALKSLQWAPRRLAFAMARVYTRLLDLAIPRLRRVARRNLSIALPEFTPARHAQIVDGVFHSIARILVNAGPPHRRPSADHIAANRRVAPTSSLWSPRSPEIPATETGVCGTPEPHPRRVKPCDSHLIRE